MLTLRDTNSVKQLRIMFYKELQLILQSKSELNDALKHRMRDELKQYASVAELKKLVDDSGRLKPGAPGGMAEDLERAKKAIHPAYPGATDYETIVLDAAIAQASNKIQKKIYANVPLSKSLLSGLLNRFLSRDSAIVKFIHPNDSLVVTPVITALPNMVLSFCALNSNVPKTNSVLEHVQTSLKDLQQNEDKLSPENTKNLWDIFERVDKEEETELKNDCREFLEIVEDILNDTSKIIEAVSDLKFIRSDYVVNAGDILHPQNGNFDKNGQWIENPAITLDKDRCALMKSFGLTGFSERDSLLLTAILTRADFQFAYPRITLNEASDDYLRKVHRMKELIGLQLKLQDASPVLFHFAVKEDGTFSITPNEIVKQSLEGVKFNYGEVKPRQRKKSSQPVRGRIPQKETESEACELLQDVPAFSNNESQTVASKTHSKKRKVFDDAAKTRIAMSVVMVGTLGSAGGSVLAITLLAHLGGGIGAFFGGPLGTVVGMAMGAVVGLLAVGLVTAAVYLAKRIFGSKEAPVSQNEENMGSSYGNQMMPLLQSQEESEPILKAVAIPSDSGESNLSDYEEIDLTDDHIYVRSSRP